MIRDARGRITMPFVVSLLFSFAYLGALYPVFADLYAENIGMLDQGTRLILQLVLPLSLLVLFTVIYVKASTG